MKDTQIEEEVQLSLFAGIIPVHIKKNKTSECIEKLAE
jgi:hypothetical protein